MMSISIINPGFLRSAGPVLSTGPWTIMKRWFRGCPPVTSYTYGLERGADFTGNGLHYASDHQFVGVEFDMDGALSGRVRVGMPGRFNADNALAALSVCSLALGEEGHEKGSSVPWKMSGWTAGWRSPMCRSGAASSWITPTTP